MAMQETMGNLGDTSSLLNNLNGRIRLLEERFMRLRENLELLNENVIEGQKELMKRIKNFDNEIKKQKTDTLELTNTINHIVKEVTLFARKDSLKVLEKYINMWNPLKFVTEEDVEKIIKKELKETTEFIKRDIPEIKERGVKSARSSSKRSFRTAKKKQNP